MLSLVLHGRMWQTRLVPNISAPCALFAVIQRHEISSSFSSTMHIEGIPSALARFHESCRIAEFSDDSLEQPLRGGQCHVYKLSFANQETWAVRIPSGLNPDVSSVMMKDETDLLKRLQESGFRWSPVLKGVELDDTNPVGHPFMVYEWVAGEPLSWTDQFPLKTEQRQHLLRQLALILLSLIVCTGKGTQSTMHSCEILN